MSVKLLYVSSWHGTLEHDELQVFHELGYDFFSTGLYLDPKNPDIGHSQRNKINKDVDVNLVDEFRRLNPNLKAHTHVKLTKEFVDNFDLVIVGHCCPAPWYIQINWEAIKHKPVIWRTYCQQDSTQEVKMQPYRDQGVYIVRVSPKERTIPGYAGDDAIIRPFVDSTVYNGWIGGTDNILTFLNFFDVRDPISNTELFLEIVKGYNYEVYGGYNEGSKISKGYLTWKNMIDKYRTCGVYFALGTKPAPITYNIIEAMMCGCPVVTWGRELGSTKWHKDYHHTYEVTDLFENGIHCFYSDNKTELELYIDLLLNDKDLALEVSKKGRERVIEIFNKNKNKESWKNFINFVLKGQDK